MKQAKKRPSPTLARLISSTRRAERAVVAAIAEINASNRRLDKLDNDDIRAWENMVPVGSELMGYGDAEAARQMQELMAGAPEGISQDELKAMINEGRD